MRVKTQQRIYTILGLLTLLCTIIGAFIACTTFVDPLPGYTPDIRSDPIMQGIVVVITGIPLFLLFVVLERRARKSSDKSQNK